MNKASVEAAKKEMIRFENKLCDWEKANEEKGERGWMLPKESGALRRASMDLTRALAEMRRPG